MPQLSSLGQITLLFVGGISFTLLKIFLKNSPKKEDWRILISLPLVWLAVLLIFTTSGRGAEGSLADKVIMLLLMIAALAWLEKYKKQILPRYSTFLLTGLYLSSLIYSLLLFPGDLGQGALELLTACLIFYWLIRRRATFFKKYLHFAILSVVVEIILFLSIFPTISQIMAETTALTLEKALTVFFTASYLPVPFLVVFYLITLSQNKNEEVTAYLQRIKSEEDFQKTELWQSEKITPAEVTFLLVVAGLQIILGVIFQQDPLFTYSFYLALLYLANEVFFKPSSDTKPASL